MSKPVVNRCRWLAVVAALLLVITTAGAQERLHRRVLEAFQSVVSEPAKSTAIVSCDGYRAAMGTVVRADGYVATKASELKGKVEVQTHNGSKYPAQIVATDVNTDLALLKI